eukprot:TRINITY_DN799_c0_g2_i4.p1 TRINITY_DN799_c0_g2~~TRINITY_DN799_c0_g2_i4.p1  ORF type:complete len:112 (-),score=17.37 TRINITY_DN799_c0_g2_i4:110-445(-)
MAFIDRDADEDELRRLHRLKFFDEDFEGSCLNRSSLFALLTDPIHDLGSITPPPGQSSFTLRDSHVMLKQTKTPACLLACVTDPAHQIVRVTGAKYPRTFDAPFDIYDVIF